MYAPQEESYFSKQPSTWVLFDLRILGVAKRLHRERAAWQEQTDTEAIDRYHLVLIVYSGGTWSWAS